MNTSLRALRRVATVSLYRRATPQLSRPALRFFSAPAASEEEVIIPGVGKGKTSTGYVSVLMLL